VALNIARISVGSARRAVLDEDTLKLEYLGRLAMWFLY
jgi:hypothetical protein